MRYSIVSGTRTPPTPNSRGYCPGCGAEVISKCGRHLVWHWAHVSKQHCDQWWESETEWHRKWKDQFPVEWQEVPGRDSVTGEIHIADVRSPSGLVIEFQHSPIHPDEVAAREAFHRRIVWIVDGCRNELDKNYFGLRLGGRISQNPAQRGLRWHGKSKLFHNWASAGGVVYIDFGTDIVWKLLNFDVSQKSGEVEWVERAKLILALTEA